MTLHQVLVVLRAQWLLVMCVFCGVMISVVALCLFWPKQFTAMASVVVDAKIDPVTAGAGGAMAGQQLTSYVNTQADIIASERVALRVVKMVHLDELPEVRKKWSKSPDQDISVELANYLLQKKMTAAPAHDSPTHTSNVIEISVKWSDAKTAAAVANAFAQAAIDTSLELKVEPAKQYASWFDLRSRALRADLEAKQKRLSDFQNATGIVATDEKLDVENARLAELSSQLVTIQALRQDSQSRQRQVSRDNESLPEVLQSPVVQSLKASLAQAEAKRPDIAARLGKNHPDYQAVEAEISNLRDRISKESASITASLSSTTKVNLRRENDVQMALEAQKKRVLELRHQHDGANMLQSDVASAQRDLDAVTQRLAESSLESLTQQTNVVQLTTASEPLHPSSPKLILDLALGLFFGVVLGVGAALFRELVDPRVREDNELFQLLEVPLLGRIGPITIKLKDARLLLQQPARLNPSSI